MDNLEAQRLDTAQVLSGEGFRACDGGECFSGFVDRVCLTDAVNAFDLDGYLHGLLCEDSGGVQRHYGDNTSGGAYGQDRPEGVNAWGWCVGLEVVAMFHGVFSDRIKWRLVVCLFHTSSKATRQRFLCLQIASD